MSSLREHLFAFANSSPRQNLGVFSAITIKAGMGREKRGKGYGEKKGKGGKGGRGRKKKKGEKAEKKKRRKKTEKRTERNGRKEKAQTKRKIKKMGRKK